MVKSYVLRWEYGIHHAYIHTDEDGFNEIIDNMSEEFTIEKDYVKDYITDYYITNYYGDKVLIGSVYSYK